MQCCRAPADVPPPPSLPRPTQTHTLSANWRQVVQLLHVYKLAVVPDTAAVCLMGHSMGGASTGSLRSEAGRPSIMTACLATCSKIGSSMCPHRPLTDTACDRQLLMQLHRASCTAGAQPALGPGTRDPPLPFCTSCSGPWPRPQPFPGPARTEQNKAFAHFTVFRFPPISDLCPPPPPPPPPSPPPPHPPSLSPDHTPPSDVL